MKFYFGHLLMIMGLLLGGLMIYGGLTTDYSTRYVDCYDKFGNEIIGETCLDEYKSGEEFILLILGIFFMTVFILVGIIMNDIEKTWEILR